MSQFNKGARVDKKFAELCYTCRKVRQVFLLNRMYVGVKNSVKNEIVKIKQKNFKK